MAEARRVLRPGGTLRFYEYVRAAGFIVLSLEEFDFPVMPPIVRPHVIGIAERPMA